ncbi:hypothetical protein [uncultured Tateyamaria sp.]|uniref:hypothetical protein n=1 Tax=uncultured Tateyamaria sp. TaxID=455651 RepID=UPI00261F3F09|nr:hypothetical protein [uncultured Tateyamaria sp.]
MTRHEQWTTVDWPDLLGIQPQDRTDILAALPSLARWYAYIIWRNDLGAPVPFYVGKGTGARVLQHSAPSEKINERKAHIFRIHQERGFDVQFSIVDSFEDEQAALDLEIDLIAMIGRKELDAGPLANRTDGGDGTRGHFALRGADNPIARAVVSDGVTYGSMAEAADAIGVSGGAIAQRIGKGWPGFYYVDEGQQETQEGILGRYMKEVHVPAGVFPSLSEAARQTGEDARLIHKHVVFGWEGYYYTDEGQRPRKSRFKACMVDGVEFESHLGAVAALDLTPGQFQKRLRSSNFPDYIDLTGTIEKQEKQSVKRTRVWAHGVEYETMSDAANAERITVGGMISRAKSSNFPDVIGEGIAKEERCGALAKNAVEVRIDGATYTTLSAASRATGWDITTIKTRCKSPSFPSYSSPDASLAKRASKCGKPSLIGVCIDGVTYRSVNAAHMETGVARAIIKRRLDSADWPNYQRAAA